MIVAVRRSDGKLYGYTPNGYKPAVYQFAFDNIQDFEELVYAEEDEHPDDFLLFEVTKVFKPNVTYQQVTDYENEEI